MVNASGTTTYPWDFENRLTSVALPGSGGTVSFKYDPFGRRIYKSSTSATSVFAYDGDNLIEETNATGAVVARYEQGLNIDEPLAMLRSSATSYYQADGLGSITSLSNSSGTNVATYAFDSFGNLTASTGSLTNPFRYTARESDTETGLYYYRARYYDQNSGRFLNEDPITFKGGINFYRYASNNPVNRIDPFGLNPATPAIPWPWSWPRPVSFPIPWGTLGQRILGGVIGAIIGELAFPDATGIDDARAIPKSKPKSEPCNRGRQSKCSLQSVGKGYCVYQCDDGTTVIDTSCTPYFYKDWGGRH
jgi:RHS repeat-associated protein